VLEITNVTTANITLMKLYNIVLLCMIKVPQIMVLGPPESGKRSISSMLCKTLGTTLITMESVLAEPAAKSQADLYAGRSEPMPAGVWAKLVQARYCNKTLSFQIYIFQLHCKCR